MKIVLMEPLRVSKEKIKELSQPLHDAGHEFVYYEEKTTDPDELRKRAEGAQIIMIANNPLPGEVLKDLPEAKLVNVAFTGFDHVGMDVAKEKGIKVCNASGYATTAVAELAVGLALGLYRKLSENEKAVHQGEAFEAPLQGPEIHGKTVGIVGTGTIGLRTAQLFKAFGVKLLGYNRSKKDEAKEMGMTYVDLDTLLGESDIVSLHLPMTEETKHLIDTASLKKMKNSAILLNLARGGVVDNDALAKALNEEEIAGAGIDVFDMEPPLPNDYPLLEAKNTLLTPHIGFLTDEAMQMRAEIAFKNTEAFINGKPENLVN